MKIEIACPYQCQYDLTWRGEGPGACNMDSLAMALRHYKKDHLVPGELPNVGDRLLKYCDDHGRDRHQLSTIRDLAIKFGVCDQASYTTSWAAIKAHLAGGNLVIAQTQITVSGHVIVIVGVDEQTGEWIINDPAGDHNAPNGYRNPGWREGDHVRYASDWFRPAAAPDGFVWAHLLKA